jgi:hypothetical protein
MNITLQDLAELERHKNLKEVHLCWLNDSMEEAFKMLKGCTHLHRLTLKKWEKLHSLSPQDLRDFIMELKHLTFLHIIYFDDYNCDHFKSLVEEVKAFVLPRRPNFKFYVSCCSKFDEIRVPSEFFCPTSMNVDCLIDEMLNVDLRNCSSNIVIL